MLALVATIAIFIFVLLLHTMMLRIACKWNTKSKPRFGKLFLAAITSLLLLGGFNAILSVSLGEQPAPMLALLSFLVGLGLVAPVLRALLKDPENAPLSYSKALGIAALSSVMTFMTMGIIAGFAVRLLARPIS
jgi:hypothetical protein